MRIATLDFETFWSTTHSLSKMSPIEYVMHPETELISCSIKVNDYPTDVFFGEAAISHALHSLDWSDTLVIGHNMSMFDALILAWRLNIHPKMWGCTLAMARPLHGNTIGLSLGKLVQHYGIGVKNNAALVNTKGKHLCDFTEAERQAMKIYNRDDTEQCYALFKKLYPQLPRRELWVIDGNIRMMVEPKFELNVPLLQTALAREQAKKRKTQLALAAMLGIEDTGDADKTAAAVSDVLMSAAKFSALLTARGVDVPLKPSPKDPEKLIPALAKSDDAFMELMDHEDDIVAAAAAARLEAKSTLLESRIQAFLRTGECVGGKLPIPARYYGAHTGRDSGELYNALNLPRINWNKDGTPVPKLTNALRMSLMAPKGHVVIVADKSGIEMRLNHHLWKVPYSMKLWQDDPQADIYKATAVKYYNIAEAEVQGPQRQFGKVLQLACGFQIGAKKFKTTAWTMGRLRLEDAECENGVQGWRQLHPEISDKRDGGWARCQEALKYIMAGQRYDLDPWGFCYTSKEGIHLPDGRIVRYPNLRAEANPKTGYTEYKYGDGRHTKYIYGGKVDENVIQALGRTILMDDKEQFYRDTGLLSQLQVYDELAYVVPEKEAESLLAHLQSIMRKPPKWWPELVVWSEGDMAPSYGLAK